MLFSGCAGKNEQFTHTCFAMDTYVRMDAYGGDAEAALHSAEYELKKLEKLFSPTLAASDARRIGEPNGGYVMVAHETAAMLETAQRVSEMTDGAFDVTVGPLVSLWGFETGAPSVPSGEAIESAKRLVDYRNLDLAGTSVHVEKGMRVSFGGIGKGMAADLLTDIFHAHHVEGALMNFGGNVQTLGKRPDGADWRVGIQDPLNADKAVGVVTAQDCAIVTSGAYQRGFTEDGCYYHHILDPKTGYPADSGLVSVTVIAKKGAYADALSTALFVMGEEKAAALYRSAGDFEMVLVTEDGRVLATEGAAFTPAQDSGYAFELLTRS